MWRPMPERGKLAVQIVQTARRIRWVYVLEAARWIYSHGREGWERLSPRERQELGRIVRKTRGRPGHITPSEREELRRIVTKAVGIGR
jgi:hypothetical protein